MLLSPEECVMDGTPDIFGNSLKYWSDLVAIELRNIEALGLAQQKMMEGWGVLAQRQAEIVQGALQGTLQRSLELKGPGNLAEQIDSLKTTILEGQANSNILSELAARSSGEAASILQSRFVAALDEYKAALGDVVPSSVSTPK
jgi:hypothetical protein